MTSEEIKERVSVRDVLKQHGVKIKRNMCSCPFHKDNDPSMAIYDKSVYCFSCGFSGDVFALTQKLDNCSFKEAYLSLGGDYKGKRDRNADYFRQAKAGLNRSTKKPIPENETHQEKVQRWTEEIHTEAHNILKALRICYDADRLEPVGSDKWHYLKTMTGYLEELYDNDAYDWRTVEKILSDYAGRERKSKEQLERELQEIM